MITHHIIKVYFYVYLMRYISMLYNIIKVYFHDKYTHYKSIL